jgi:phenylalanyl-tRNA synthetase beta subunit
VDRGVKVNDIIRTVREADVNGLVRDVDVFDIFLPTGDEKLKAEGSRSEYGKSVAFHVIMRADDYTLTDKEADAVQTAITTALQEKLSARIR